MTEYIRRFYECFYVPGEKLPVHFKVNLIKPNEKHVDIEALKKQDNKKPVITIEDVKSWFPQGFFEIDNVHAIALVEKLNLMRVTKPVDPIDNFKPMENILKSLRSLSDQLPVGIDFIAEKIKQSSSKMEDYIKNLQELSKFLETIKQDINQMKNKGFLITSDKHLKFWHTDAVIIARQVSTYWKFHGQFLSFKQADSKLIKTVKLALERANVIHVSEQTIVQALNRFPTKKEYQKLIKYAPDN